MHVFAFPSYLIITERETERETEAERDTQRERERERETLALLYLPPSALLPSADADGATCQQQVLILTCLTSLPSLCADTPSSYALLHDCILVKADKTQAEIDAEARAWKDYFGNCVKAPIGYKTYMIEDPALQKNGEDEGEGKWFKFTPEVGPVGERKPKPFAFKTILPGPSRLVAVKLPRPMGITFEMDSQG